MNCPKCGSETIDRYCQKCENSIREIYLKLSDDAQGNRDYNTAIMYLEDLMEILEIEEEKEEIRRIRDGIEFIKINEDTSGERAVNPKNINWLRNLRISSKTRKILSLILFVILVLSGSYFGNEFYNKREAASNAIIDGRRLKTAIIVNIDSAVTPEWDIADKIYYQKIFKMIRKHKNIRVNLAMTGRTLQVMNIYSPDTMQIIREGIRDGQIELLGTTFSNAVVYSLSENSAKLQIEKDRNLKKEFLGSYPKGFWNNGNVWKGSIPGIIGDYSYTFISDELISKSSSLDLNFIRTTDGRKTAVVTIDSKISNMVNKLGEFNKNEIGDSEIELYKYLRNTYKKDKSGKYLIAIESEIFNLKDGEIGKKELIEARIGKIERLLSVIESKPWIDSVTLSSVALQEDSIENIESIPEGIFPGFSEKKFGYKSWIEYNNSSENLIEYRKTEKLFEESIIENLQSENKSVKNLAKYAKEILLHIEGNIGTDKSANWKDEWIKDGITALNVINEAVSNIRIYREGIYSKDIDSDGKEEIIAVKSGNFYIFSPENGGRLIYWIDMKNGKILTGGEAAHYSSNQPAGVGVYHEPYIADANYGEYEKTLKNKKYYINNGGLNEIVEIEGKTAKIYNEKMNFESPDSSTLIFKSGEFVKKIVMRDNGLSINYSVPAASGDITVYSEIQPDYLNLINSETKVKKGFDTDKAEILNRATKTAVDVRFPVGSKVYSTSSFAGEIIFIKTGLKSFNIELAKK